MSTRPRERKVHIELASLPNRLHIWAEVVFISQVQQMVGVTRVGQRANGGYEVHLDPRVELPWLLEQLSLLAQLEEQGGAKWLM